MMEIRPIDANALIEWIMPYLHTGDTVEVDTILEDIRAQPTLSLQWISVEDRLPLGHGSPGCPWPCGECRTGSWCG